MASGNCPSSTITNVQGSNFTIKSFFSLSPQCDPSLPSVVLPNVSQSSIVDTPPTIQDNVSATNGELLIAQKDTGGHFSIDPNSGDLFVNDVDADKYSIDEDSGNLIYDPCA